MPKLTDGIRQARRSGSDRRPTINTRLRADLRARVEASAIASGRSMAGEIEHIIEQHFERADLRTIIREEIAAEFDRREAEGSAVVGEPDPLFAALWAFPKSDERLTHLNGEPRC